MGVDLMENTGTTVTGGLWVICGTAGGGLTAASRLVLAGARTLGDQLGAPVAALLLGGDDGAAPPTQEAIAYGADRVLVLHDARLAPYDAPAWTAALAALAAPARPALILLPDDSRGRDLAPRLAYTLGAALIAAVDPTTLEVDAYTGAPAATRRRWGGRLLTTLAGTGTGPAVITLGRGATLEPYYDDWRYGDTEMVDLTVLNIAWPEEPGVTILPESAPLPVAPDWHPQVAAWRALRAARVVVTGGTGLGSAEAFALVPELAAALNGEWGADHDAVEAGWAPPEREIGVRGVSVRPDLYLAVGATGSPEHVAAMQQARLIVAVAADPTAPLLRWATWPVVADPAAFARALLERLGRDVKRDA